MSRDTVLACWVEADSGEYKVEAMGTTDLRSGSYESEVHIKLARNAAAVAIIPIEQMAEPWAQAQIAELKAKGEVIRRGGIPPEEDAA